MTLKTSVLTLLLAAASQVALASTVPAGPEYPAPGGNSFSGSGVPGDSGGWDLNYSGFNIPVYDTGFWQGLWDPTSAAAGLDGTAHTLTFTGLSVGNTVATWEGTTGWTAPDTTYYPSIPVRLDVSVTAGGLSWSTLPLAGYTFPAIGAVIDNLGGVNYSLNASITADVGSGYVPLNSISQPTGGLTQSSVSFGFYSVPEPSTFIMLGIALVAATGCGVARRRRRTA